LTNRFKAWFLLITLSVIWGGSYFLIKNALHDGQGNIRLQPHYLGALRMTIAALALSPFLFMNFSKIKSYHWRYLLIAGFCGNGIPAFLFSFAQMRLDSAVTGMLNSTTPLFAIAISTLIFKFQLRWHHVLGITVGIIGTSVIMWSKLEGISISPKDIWPFMMVLGATLCYAISLNTIKYKLPDLNPITITSASFGLVGIPTLLYLLFNGFIFEAASTPKIMEGVAFVTVLALVGTALAVLLFNHLIQLSSAVFASSVTYFMPVVATLLGILSGELVSGLQYLGLFVLVVGVVLINKPIKK
jgi:drug/metabolite transporter (DMT)-like permease